MQGVVIEAQRMHWTRCIPRASEEHDSRQEGRTQEKADCQIPACVAACGTGIENADKTPPGIRIEAMPGVAVGLVNGGLHGGTMALLGGTANADFIIPPHSPTPVRVLTVSGAGGAKAISCSDTLSRCPA